MWHDILLHSSDVGQGSSSTSSTYCFDGVGQGSTKQKRPKLRNKIVTVYNNSGVSATITPQKNSTVFALPEKIGRHCMVPMTSRQFVFIETPTVLNLHFALPPKLLLLPKAPFGTELCFGSPRQFLFLEKTTLGKVNKGRTPNSMFYTYYAKQTIGIALRKWLFCSNSDKSLALESEVTMWWIRVSIVLAVPPCVLFLSEKSCMKQSKMRSHWMSHYA